MPTYELYGLRLESDFPFANHLAPVTGPADLLVEEGFEMFGLQETPSAIYESPYKLKDGRTQLSVEAFSHGDIFTLTGVARFHITPERISYELLNEHVPHTIEILLLGTVLSIWLERRGLAALHAASVVVDDKAVAFLATNKGGKSSLAASLMQLGYPLLTDDILAIESTPTGLLGRPGYPQMRMWPDQAAHFVADYKSLELVHPELDKRRVPIGTGLFGSFQSKAAPPKRFYLPERGAAAIRVEPLSFGEALMVFVEYSFLLGVPETLGLEPARFRLFAKLAQQASVSRLSYPDGVEHLPEVRQAILEDIANSD